MSVLAFFLVFCDDLWVFFIDVAVAARNLLDCYAVAIFNLCLLPMHRGIQSIILKIAVRTYLGTIGGAGFGGLGRCDGAVSGAAGPWGVSEVGRADNWALDRVGGVSRVRTGSSAENECAARLNL